MPPSEGPVGAGSTVSGAAGVLDVFGGPLGSLERVGTFSRGGARVLGGGGSGRDGSDGPIAVDSPRYGRSVGSARCVVVVEHATPTALARRIPVMCFMMMATRCEAHARAVRADVTARAVVRQSHSAQICPLLVPRLVRFRGWCSRSPRVLPRAGTTCRRPRCRRRSDPSSRATRPSPGRSIRRRESRWSRCARCQHARSARRTNPRTRASRPSRSMRPPMPRPRRPHPTPISAMYSICPRFLTLKES